jgi:hypothetical protein
MAKKKEEWLTEAAPDETWNSTDNAWYQQAMQTAQALLDRPAFSYDPAADPLYRTAKDQYLRQGRRAMEDVLGRTASLTGGYASSYAQTQASQAYDDQLTRLSALLPDYYDRARAAYDRETAALRDELGTAIGLYDKDYQVWLDRQSARERQTEADRKAEQWERQFSEDHDRWAAEFAQAAERWAAQQAASEASLAHSDQANARSYAYRMAMLALQQGLSVSDALLETAGIDKAYAESIRQYYYNLHH